MQKIIYFLLFPYWLSLQLKYSKTILVAFGAKWQMWWLCHWLFTITLSSVVIITKFLYTDDTTVSKHFNKTYNKSETMTCILTCLKYGKIGSYLSPSNAFPFILQNVHFFYSKCTVPSGCAKNFPASLKSYQVQLTETWSWGSITENFQYIMWKWQLCIKDGFSSNKNARRNPLVMMTYI